MSSAVLEQLMNMLNGGSNRAAASANAAFKFNNIEPRVQSHLSRVYMLLAACACIAALGTAAHIAWGIHGFLTQVWAVLAGNVTQGMLPCAGETHLHIRWFPYFIPPV